MNSTWNSASPLLHAVQNIVSVGKQFQTRQPTGAVRRLCREPEVIVTMPEINPQLTGGQSGNGLANATNRPDQVGHVSYPHTVGEWFDTAAFVAPAKGAFGNAGHNSLRGPGRDNWNLSLFKSFVLSEARGSRFELRVESFNTWNHTEFNQVSNGLGSSNFGQVTSAFDPRVFQLGAKLYF